MRSDKRRRPDAFNDPDPEIPFSEQIAALTSEDEVHRAMVRLVKSLKVHGASYAYTRRQGQPVSAFAEMRIIDGLLDEVLVVLGTPVGADMVWILRPGAHLG